jgi:type IV fimbrial biogenesis protein FimT
MRKPMLPSTGRGARRAAGFTLVELMVTLTILALLGMIAVPAFNNAILGNKLAGFTNSFMAGVQVARSEAIKRNAAVKMCRSADGASCAGSGGWQQGWIIFNDVDGNDAINNTETRIHYQQKLSDDFSFTGDTYTIVMQPTGLAATSAALTLCRSNPVGAQERTVTLSTTGRVSIAKTTTGTCS